MCAQEPVGSVGHIALADCSLGFGLSYGKPILKRYFVAHIGFRDFMMCLLVEKEL